jgi:hypothetical protein
MTLEGKRIVVAVLGFLFLGSLVAVTLVDAVKHREIAGPKPPVVPEDSKACVDCHSRVTPLQVAQWSASKHGEQGIACVSCHGAKPEDPDGFMHHEVRISAIVTPKDCGGCHRLEAEGFGKSAHGQAKPGLEIKLVKGRPDPETWPLPRIGRKNPDGSAGTCTTCHGRHRFELADARQPTVCETCHLSDGSAEAWLRSPHGGFFLTSATLETAKGPSCTVCHMASRTGAPTHDVSARVTWMRSPEGKWVQRANAEARRDAMFATCLLCHASPLVDAAFARIDETFEAGMPAGNPPATAPYLKAPPAWPHLSPTDREELAKLQGRK